MGSLPTLPCYDYIKQLKEQKDASETFGNYRNTLPTSGFQQELASSLGERQARTRGKAQSSCRWKCQLSALYYRNASIPCPPPSCDRLLLAWLGARRLLIAPFSLQRGSLTPTYTLFWPNPWREVTTLRYWGRRKEGVLVKHVWGVVGTLSPPVASRKCFSEALLPPTVEAEHSDHGSWIGLSSMQLSHPL